MDEGPEASHREAPMTRAAPFAAFEFLIAWRYLRAKRAEGGVSAMTWISLIGIALAVAALIIVLAVRSGFRTEFVDAILGANAHVTVYEQRFDGPSGSFDYRIEDFEALTAQVQAVPGGHACSAADTRAGHGHGKRSKSRGDCFWHHA
jgi:lipoprotein-releasing system permease protein